MIKINLLGDTLAQTAAKASEKAEAVQVYADGQEAVRTSLPIAGVIFGLILASFGGVYYIVLNGKVEEAARTRTELEAKKKDLAKYTALEKTFQAQKGALAKKKEIMLNLKTYQHLPVHLMEEMANCVPDDVWFKEINQKGMNISIKGESTSFEAINQFRNRIMAQGKWFTNVNQPAATKNGRTVEFTISCDLNPSA